jgi:hypothetical protein
VTTTDIEFRLEEIHDTKVAAYFAEALTCYRHGAYRACIGMIHNTIFSDLLEKIRHLATVNTDARTVLHKIESLEAHDAYEAKLETEMKAVKLLEPEQCRFLHDLRNRRNDAAHPRGHVVTKEHVHYLLSDAITFFLKERTVYPRQAVADLREKLRGDAFLPASGSPGNHRKVVAEEMTLFNEKTYGALFAMLATTLSGSEEIGRRNARKFVETVAGFNDERVRSHIFRSIYSRKLSAIGDFDDDYTKALFWSFVWDPQIGSHFTDGQLLQFDQSLASYCTGSLGSDPDWPAPDFLFDNLLATTPDLLGDRLPRTTGFLAANYPATRNGLALLKVSPTTRDFIFESYRAIVDGKDRHTVRRLLAFLAENESHLVEEHDPETALRLLRAIRFDRSLPENERYELKALRARVHDHYGMPLDRVPRDVAQRCHLPQGAHGQMRLDTIVRAPQFADVPLSKELEWDWSR